jgi:hypothetical protein
MSNFPPPQDGKSLLISPVIDFKLAQAMNLQVEIEVRIRCHVKHGSGLPALLLLQQRRSEWLTIQKC